MLERQDEPVVTTTSGLPVAVAGLDQDDFQAVMPIAAAIARTRDVPLLLLSIVEVPADQPLSAGAVEAQRRRALLDQLARSHQGPVHAYVRVAHETYAAICDVVREEHVGLLLVGWPAGRMPAERIFGPPLDQLFAAPPCDLAGVKHQGQLLGHRIVLPASGGAHQSLSFDVAASVADAAGGTLTMLHAFDPQRPGEQLALDQIRALGQHGRIDFYVERPAPALDAILDAAAEADVVVLGATGRDFGPMQPVGPLAEAVLKAVDATVIITRRVLRDAEKQTVERFEALRDTSAQVERWFAENTFSAGEFDDLAHLLALKLRHGVTISLALPALNEAETIGPLIDALKGPLLDQIPLLDEIVVIDSRSTDETRAIAAARGVPVFVHQEILPHYGAFAGKGEALWKSLFVTRGDIVVWVDTDIRDIHPRFVYGLVGPLLRESRLQFTKGFYRRPIAMGGQIVEGGGGRVTELVARPLFNLFFPELSGFVQPLAGEYAVRRAVAERLPFFTGYSVETALLVDLLRAVGLGAMAQVDLQQRIHRNQELHGLTRMSFAIIQTVIQRLEADRRLGVLDPLVQSLRLIQYGADGGYQLDVRDIRDHERPPIVTLPEYAERGASP